MSLTNVYKKKIYKPLIPILSFLTIIVLNSLNAWLFDGIIKEAIKDAVIVGGVTIGLFNVGDATGKAINKPKSIN
jgi:hypothetical protein